VKPKPDKCVEILQINITNGYTQRTTAAF